ncbi:hypothetical protein VTK73DRAFT_6877 [Phialemonium thermophilum]|uniref:Major facilitator superfamily (MFS) profile domain-containing protein n=1 Tax=Phialemonium thermophilum TaxID=223376 RepID=A0ABR3WI44_9PEZI
MFENNQHLPQTTPATQAYSAFLPWQKNCIIGLAAFAGWFSSISSFIYFPAIPFIAADLGVGIGKINLTVTSYLIMSGIFPSLMGDAADRFGRRPVFLVALTCYLAANIGLALQSRFELLFLLRMLQSMGISGTFSVTYGVLSDLFTPAERGSYSGVISFFLNTPPSLGPIFSGLLLLRWRWNSIFWFLSVATPFCLVPMAICLPETARNLVGNGTVRPAMSMNRAPVRLLTAPQDGGCDVSCWDMGKRRAVPNPFSSLKLVRRPGTALILAVYAVGYSVYVCLQASISTIFLDAYQVAGVVSGLVYLPFGVACAVSAFATGLLLDRNFRRTAAECKIPVVDARLASSLEEFPIEKARLRTIGLFVGLGAVLLMGYGWLLQFHVTVAGPLVAQFFMGLTIQTLFTALNTLLVDVHQDCPSTAQAACNFVRCEAAAAWLAGLDPLLGHLGPGWCFVTLGAVLFLAVPALHILQRRGMQWRQARTTKT